ncbi:MAG: molybdopterin molybdenumtransferase MoeA, partial [Sulfurovum sp.]|nr:molybdopterin molybdenumtransferase MoeA [Sulfurovum sp.]
MTTFDTLSLLEAHTIAFNHAVPKNKSEIIAITDANGRILSKAITAKKNLPSFDNSAMDGFAFRFKDTGKRLRVASTIFAGEV